MGRLDANGQQVRLTPTLGETTVIHDRKRNIAIMTIEGVVVLPIGAEVELINPNLNATVVGVRLLAPWDGKVHVCLDVDVPEEYWDEEER